jgi:ATP sulfurylase
MINKVIRGFCRPESSGDGVYALDAVSMLVEPHGGWLVHREADPADLADLDDLPRLVVSERDLMDCEQFGYGTYSPLAGFMDRETLDEVLAHHRLPGGEVWTMPLLLPLDPEAPTAFASGDRVALTDHRGTIHALLDVSEVYDYDLDDLAAQMFGTTSRHHPGVVSLMAQGGRFVAGDVTLVRPLASDIRHYLLTPAQTRFVFTRLGWSRVVGFHTRNVAHRGHEWIQREALARTGADGLYINPVVGAKKRGDFLSGPILTSYQRLLEFGCYPDGKVVLGSFFTYSRYAGPREAVFTALCRKNMGCSHFIVGRDHTGVGDFYAPDANRALFDSLGDLGIEPVFFDAVGYNPETEEYEMSDRADLLTMSGTQVREALRSEQHLPQWFMREIVQDALLDQLRRGDPLFVE